MEKNILLLDDGRTGNFRQVQSAAKIAADHLKKQGISSNTDIQEIKFKNKFARTVLILISAVLGKYIKSCHCCLRQFLKPEVYDSLMAKKPDVIISGGYCIVPVNLILSAEKSAKSVVVMKPPTISLSSFDLAIIPRHDNPPERENIVITEGALDFIDADYLEKQTRELFSSSVMENLTSKLRIGLLIGGNTKGFHLTAGTMQKVLKQIKSVAQDLNADILVSTSRRTSPAVEELVKKEFQDYPHCKLLVIANEKNIPQAVGGILGLSHIVVISPESVMMISEAVSSGKYVLVFESRGLNRKHRSFLNNFAKDKYIRLTEASNLGQAIRDISSNKPQVTPSRDKFLVAEAISRIL